MKTEQQDAIYRRTLQLVREHFDHPEELPGGTCFPFMICGLMAIGEMTELTSMPQAGSAQFKFLPDHMDDGITATHFSYMWQPNDSLSLARIAAGQLPEVHCWLAIRETREVVDFSTGFIQQDAIRNGYPWHTPNLPPYIWRREGDPYPGTCYLPDLQAIRFIVQFAENRLIKKGRLCH